MSHIARQHIQQAVKAYLEEDGASDEGAFRDLITDTLHLARKKFRINKRFRDIDNLYHYVCAEGFDMFREELMTAEVKKVRNIPKKKLALHLNDKFEFDEAKEIFNLRLKGEI